METNQFLSNLLAAKNNLFDMGTGSPEKWKSVETDLFEIAKLNSNLTCWPSDLELDKMNGLVALVESNNKLKHEFIKLQRPIEFDMAKPNLDAIQRKHNVQFDVVRTSRTLKFLRWESIKFLYQHIYESVDRGTDVIVFVQPGPDTDKLLKLNDDDPMLKKIIDDGYSFKDPTKLAAILEEIGFIGRTEFDVDRTLSEHPDGSKTVLKGRLMHFQKS